ncbi:MAG TPA: hypothetical protein VEK10_07180 [Steroidobacteraceae bacterium]|nr:hypothetical protein [Steroidobacteraceae bacterium]
MAARVPRNWPHSTTLVLRADFLDRQILIQAAPSVFFITEHYRNYPWVLVRFSAIQERELPELLERAWRLAAPKTLVKNYDAGERPTFGRTQDV